MIFEDSARELAAIEIPRDDLTHLHSLQSWISAHTGLSYPPKKNGVLYSRMQTLSMRLGLSGIAEIDALLHGENSEWLAKEVVRVASTNFTFFFREYETLDFFQRQIVPSLPAGEKWRIWSAAAASGEEAYSIAILLAECLGLTQLGAQAAILGTDISYKMIEQAERSIYPENRLEALPAMLRKRYMEPHGAGAWQVIPALRECCTFRRLNLMVDSWPFRQTFNVILCRNIFYYFDKEQQLEVVERLYDAASPNGWLVTSVTETFYGLPIRWKRVAAGVWCK